MPRHAERPENVYEELQNCQHVIQLCLKINTLKRRKNAV